MKILFDFFPIILFFAVFKTAQSYQQASFQIVSTYMAGMVADGAIKPDQAPIMLATMVAIIATTLQLIYIKIRGRKIDTMLWISFIIIAVFGGLTIYLHNEKFIMWKPTIICWLSALVMLVMQFGFGKNPMRQAMEEQVKLPEPVWTRLGLAWIAFFVVMGAVNLLAAFVIFAGNTSGWVSFKLFGMLALTFVFIIGQTMYLSRYITEEKA
jgi:intracellular septation protein